MKKKLEKVLSFLLVFAFVVMGCTLSNTKVKAAESTNTATDAASDETSTSSEAGNVVKIYYNTADGWEAVNIWAWTIETTIDLAKNPWPGDAMTDEGNGWFSAEITADEKIGVLFTDNAGGQTSDCKDLEPGKTYWITNGSEDLLNDSGMGGGVSLTAATEPQAGWPEGPAAEATTTTAETAEKTDSNNVMLYVIIAVAAVAVIIVVVVLTKKKKGAK